jgi:hypothetical protein
VLMLSSNENIKVVFFYKILKTMTLKTAISLMHLNNQFQRQGA